MAFLVQALLVVVILYLGRRIEDPGVQGAKPSFDLVGAILSAAGLFFVVVGILQAGTYGWFRADAGFCHRQYGRDPAGRHLAGLVVRG